MQSSQANNEEGKSEDENRKATEERSFEGINKQYKGVETQVANQQMMNRKVLEDDMKHIETEPKEQLHANLDFLDERERIQINAKDVDDQGRYKVEPIATVSRDLDCTVLESLENIKKEKTNHVQSRMILSTLKHSHVSEEDIKYLKVRSSGLTGLNHSNFIYIASTVPTPRPFKALCHSFTHLDIRAGLFIPQNLKLKF